MSRTVGVYLEMLPDEWRIFAEIIDAEPGFSDVADYIRARVDAVACEDRATDAMRSRNARYFGDGSKDGACAPTPL